MTHKTTVYLDYNATAPMLPVVQQAITEVLPLIGNPSSIHSFGREVRKRVEIAREQVAALANVDAKNVTFTSGATEANNTVLMGAPVERILISAIEHPSIVDTAKHKNTVTLPVTSNGVIDLNALEKALAENNHHPTLVSVMWVNNETGVIQPIEEIAELCKRSGALFHTDAVQGAGRLPLHMNNIQYMSLSAHKIGGPSGIGALIYDHDTPLNKFMHGGGQEKRRRAGTENILGIIGFGAAADYARTHSDHYKTLAAWHDELEQKIIAAIPDAVIAGRDALRVGNTSQIILPKASAEKQLMALDLNGIAVSSGAACSSGSIKPSHVLLAMGLSEELSRCAIRVSSGFATSKDDLDSFFQGWVANSQRLRTA